MGELFADQTDALFVDKKIAWTAPQEWGARVQRKVCEGKPFACTRVDVAVFAAGIVSGQNLVLCADEKNAEFAYCQIGKEPVGHGKLRFNIERRACL